VTSYYTDRVGSNSSKHYRYTHYENYLDSSLFFFVFCCKEFVIRGNAGEYVSFYSSTKTHIEQLMDFFKVQFENYIIDFNLTFLS
jgi:hypothetical protein